MLAIDRYAWTNRWRWRHPAEKLALAGGLLLISITLPPLTTAPLVLLTVSVVTVLGAGIPLKTLAWVVAIPGAFLVPGVLLLAVSIDFSEGITVSTSASGLTLAASVALRSLAAVTALAFLTLTTPLVDWLPWLRRIGLPQPLLEIMLLLYRLLFVLAGQAITGAHAQAARQGYSTVSRSIRSLGLLSAGLLQRALARARRLEHGLAARGFSGELRVLTPPQPLSLRRLAGIGILLGAVALAGVLLDAGLQ